MSFVASFSNYLEDQNITVDKNTIIVDGSPVGILIPSVTYTKNNDKIIINGKKGLADAVIGDTEDIWASLIASGSVLFGEGEQVMLVQNYLNSLELSRTVSYLCNIHENCCDLLKSIKTIQQTTIAVIGLGGIGSLAAMSLAGIGCRKLLLVDHDTIEISNLNRQFFYTRDDIGLLKAEVLAREITRRFPKVSVVPRSSEVRDDNIQTLVEDSDCVLATADDPIGIVANIINYCRKNSLAVVACGYLHETSTVYYERNQKRGSVVIDNPFNFQRGDHSIMPSLGSNNIEIAGIVSSIILHSMCNKIEELQLKFSWKTDEYPRIQTSFQ